MHGNIVCHPFKISRPGGRSKSTRPLAMHCKRQRSACQPLNLLIEEIRPNALAAAGQSQALHSRRTVLLGPCSARLGGERLHSQAPGCEPGTWDSSLSGRRTTAQRYHGHTEFEHNGAAGKGDRAAEYDPVRRLHTLAIEMDFAAAYANSMMQSYYWCVFGGVSWRLYVRP